MLTDPAETRHLIKTNLRLVDWWLRRFVYHHYKLSYQDRQDARSACRMGLILAAQRHDAARGRFSTFAVEYIRGNYLAWRKSNFRQRLRNHLEYRDPLEMEHKVIDPREPDLPSLDTASFWRDCAWVLMPRDVRILRGRFVEDKTLEKVGLDLSISKERVRQLEVRALRRLRNYFPRRYERNMD